MKQVICIRCHKCFGLQKKMSTKYDEDGLCGKCRAHIKYLTNIDKHRKTKHCPGCGKMILKTSQYCNSCSQLGKNNHNYKHGRASKLRTCRTCNKPITSGSKKGQCLDCYLSGISGESNPNYKHGIYAYDLMNTNEYLFWRLSIYERDNRICQMCGRETKHDCHAHHIFPKRDYPERIFDIDNGITLCPECHAKINQKEYDHIDYFTNLIGRSKIAELSRNLPMGQPEPKAEVNTQSGATTS